MRVRCTAESSGLVPRGMIRTMRTVVRRSLAAEDKDLAVLIGTRLRAARQRAGLTQREVAEPRYTKAYISALENGLIKPSMAALRFVATKLGTTASELLADTDLQWDRTEAELRLAAGDWQAAIDAWRTILERGAADADRGIAFFASPAWEWTIASDIRSRTRRSGLAWGSVPTS